MGTNNVGLIGAAVLLTLCCLALPQTQDEAAQARLAKHAEVFRYAAGLPSWPRLEDLKPNPEGIILHQRSVIADYMRPTTPITETEELAQLATRRDVNAVISGTTVTRYSAIDPTHTFLYSDWIVTVSKVYKNTSTVQIDSEAAVTRMGGDLTLNGRHIIDREPVFPDFALNHSYVFYLRALPDSSSFQALPGGTFDMTGTTPVLLADPRDPTGLRAFSSWSTSTFLPVVEWSANQDDNSAPSSAPSKR